MTKAILFHETGGPDVLRYEDVPADNPGPGEVRVRHHAIGVNFIDVYHRTGLYPVPSLPSGLGTEAAGVIDAIGPGVTDFQVGDRVTYCTGPRGAYAEARVISAQLLVKLPRGISFEEAAAATLKGLTAQYLLRRTYRVRKGDKILIHAAAGGVGLLVCQWARALGATVIGTVGSDDKARLAAEHGCDHPINYAREDFVARVREITGGEGVAVVYDSIGKDTFDKSLDCLRPLGLMVSFGNSTGPVPPFETSKLAARGSLFLTRPSLFQYVAKREDLLTAADDFFAMVLLEKIRIGIHHKRPLAEAAEAHRDLEARKTTGSTILIP